jgi:hypothetical protein
VGERGGAMLGIRFCFRVVDLTPLVVQNANPHIAIFLNPPLQELCTDWAKRNFIRRGK